MPAQVLGLDTGGMDAAECGNPDCSEYGIVKPLLTTLMEGEQVWCGVCQQACPVDFYQGLTYTIPAPPWEEAIEAQNAKLDRLTVMLAQSLNIDPATLEDTP